jgi:hypothetical protein
MIKFFRRIRQNLLSEGKTGKYFKYAIGEIVLVVIGILIAVQINNWNESRKSDNQETLYLERLLLENKQDLLTFAKSIEDLKKGNQSIRELAAALNNNQVHDSVLLNSVRDYLIYGCHYPFFNPSTSTFEDLSSTGNLGVIKDTELRDLIVSHYAKYKYTNSNFEVNTNWALPIDAPFYIENDVLKYEPTAAFLFEKYSANSASNNLREHKQKYIRNAGVHYWVNEDCINLLNGVREETVILIGKLESEINSQ